jgi:hypothetical protein
MMMKGAIGSAIAKPRNTFSPTDEWCEPRSPTTSTKIPAASVRAQLAEQIIRGAAAFFKRVEPQLVCDAGHDSGYAVLQRRRANECKGHRFAFVLEQPAHHLLPMKRPAKFA